MSRVPRASFLLVALVLLSGTVAACDGGTGSTTPAAPGATATPTPVATPTPSPTPTPTPAPPEISSTSTYYSGSPPTINFTAAQQTAVVTLSEAGYSGQFTVVPDTPQTNGTGCTGTIATVAPSSGTAFTFVSSSSANACGSLQFTFADTNLSNITLTVVLTQSGLNVQGKQKH